MSYLNESKIKCLCINFQNFRTTVKRVRKLVKGEIILLVSAEEDGNSGFD